MSPLDGGTPPQPLGAPAAPLELGASLSAAREERRARLGRRVALWMLPATALYVLLFYALLGQTLAGHISLAALALHGLLWWAHRARAPWAASASLLVGLSHLTLIDILALHTTLSVFLWMMTLSPLAVMTCATRGERRAVVGVAVALMLATFFVGERARGAVDLNSLIASLSLVGATLLITRTTAWALEAMERAEERQLLEHARSEALLLNILPAEVAERLKGATRIEERVIADNYEQGAVLFADICGFTALSSTLEPQELVRMLNRYFTAFDQLAALHMVEKIKTIGDAYMAASGILRRDSSSVEHLAEMALDMLKEVDRLNAETGYSLSLRVGMNVGAVTAGVIGEQKFIYDLWGDSVNVASRMESTGEPGRVQVTRAVVEALHPRFRFTPAGVRQVKGKGELETFWLEGRA